MLKYCNFTKMVHYIVYEDKEFVRYCPVSPQRLDHYIKLYNGFEVDLKDLPPTAYQKNWVLDKKNKRVTVDMVGAIETKKEQLREFRKLLFNGLDRDYIEALSRGKDLTDIKLRQQKLRDITKDLRLKNAKNLEDLDSIRLDL